MRIVGSPVSRFVPHASSRWMRGVSQLCALGCLCGCDVYRAELLDISRVSRADAATRDAAFDAGPAAPSSDAAASVECARGTCWWSQTVHGCASAGRPLPESRPLPPTAAEPSSQLEDIYLGLSEIHMTETADEPSFGLDLDDACSDAPTCPGQSMTSCKPRSSDLVRDGDDCSDNSFSKLMATLARVPELADRLGLRDSAIRCELWRGGYNVLLRVTDYDGSLDDASVRVDWYTSSGLTQTPDWRCPEPDFETKHVRWSSGARWEVDARELSAEPSARERLPASKIFDPHAYVRGGYLVSRLPSGALLRFAGDAKPLRGFALSAGDALWLGRLRRSGDRTWAIQDGLIAGRVRTDELLRSFRQAGLCRTGGAAAFFDAFHARVLDSADVLADGTSAPERACDAVSFGIRFRAAQVTPGGASRALEPLVECCDPGRSLADCEPRCGDGVVGGSERCDTAIADGHSGACPTECPSSRPCTTSILEGTGCERRCVEQPIQTDAQADGCCPEHASARADPDCAPKCGNGVLEAGETCDPPSACPNCGSEDRCLRMTATGAAETCDLVCEAMAITECRSEDGCCPERCTRGADNDCSALCGNGRVDPGTTETCEPGSSTPCSVSCDDQDHCTNDVATGSRENCNLRCSHVRFGVLGASDGCCPIDADLTVDPDC